MNCRRPPLDARGGNGRVWAEDDAGCRVAALAANAECETLQPNTLLNTKFQEIYTGGQHTLSNLALSSALGCNSGFPGFAVFETAAPRPCPRGLSAGRRNIATSASLNLGQNRRPPLHRIPAFCSLATRDGFWAPKEGTATKRGRAMPGIGSPRWTKKTRKRFRWTKCLDDVRASNNAAMRRNPMIALQ